MAVGAQLFAALTQGSPLDSFAKGAAIRQSYDNAAQQQTAEGFHFLLNVLDQQQKQRQHNDTIGLALQRLGETTRYHDAELALRKAKLDQAANAPGLIDTQPDFTQPGSQQPPTTPTQPSAPQMTFDPSGLVSQGVLAAVAPGIGYAIPSADTMFPVGGTAVAQPDEKYAALPPQSANEQPMGNPRGDQVPQLGAGLRTGNPLLPPLHDVTGSAPAPAAQPNAATGVKSSAPKSDDPTAWENIKDGSPVAIPTVKNAKGQPIVAELRSRVGDQLFTSVGKVDPKGKWTWFKPTQYKPPTDGTPQKIDLGNGQTLLHYSFPDGSKYTKVINPTDDQAKQMLDGIVTKATTVSPQTIANAVKADAKYQSFIEAAAQHPENKDHYLGAAEKRANEIAGTAQSSALKDGLHSLDQIIGTPGHTAKMKDAAEIAKQNLLQQPGGKASYDQMLADKKSQAQQTLAEATKGLNVSGATVLTDKNGNPSVHVAYKPDEASKPKTMTDAQLLRGIDQNTTALTNNLKLDASKSQTEWKLPDNAGLRKNLDEQIGSIKSILTDLKAERQRRGLKPSGIPAASTPSAPAAETPSTHVKLTASDLYK